MSAISRCNITLVFMMKGLGISCTSSNMENKTDKAFEPRFVITDSLVINYLGALHIMNIKPDRSEYFMFDFQRKEMVRVDSKGQILLTKNLTGDNKDGYGEYFISAHYHGVGPLKLI